MAFDITELSQMAYTGAAAGANAHWFYRNSEADTATASGFFNGATHMLKNLDTIYIANTGVTLRVSSATGAATVTTAANYAAPG